MNDDNAQFIIIGGAEDKEHDKEILKKVCSYMDINNDLLLIVTVASEYPKEVLEKYKRVFGSLNVKKIEGLFINDRMDAYSQENITLVDRSKIIFFTGGDQLRITSMIGGTPINDSIKEAVKKGCIIVGTSAGASVMPNVMIVEGEEEESPKKGIIQMSPGLGLVKDVIIDQHFAQRGRIGRLLSGIAQNPQILGIGIDEDTAIIVCRDGYLKVIGNSAVYFIDGRNITYTTVSEQNPDEILSMYNVTLHILKAGEIFDLKIKKPFEEEG